jgi:Zn-dependent protease with chaperone function
MIGLHTWRRRIAALRLFHLAVVIGGIYSVLSLIVTFAQFIRTPWSDERVGVTAAMVLLIACIAVIFHRRMSFSRSWKSYLGPLIDTRKIESLALLQQRMADFARIDPEKIEFHRTAAPKRPPAAILRDSKGKLHIVLRYEMLVSLCAQRRDPEAIIWHEFGHFLQWDTRLGYWSLRAIDLFGLMTLWMAVFASILMIGILGYAAVVGRLGPRVWILSLLEIAATLFLLGVFWFMRHWHRFSEFNADLTATVAGYGEDLIAFLTTFPNAHTTMIKRFSGIHPAPSRRIRSIRRALLDSKSSINTPNGNVRIGGKDYVLGAIIYIAPLWVFFTLLCALLVAVVEATLQHKL